MEHVRKSESHTHFVNTDRSLHDHGVYKVLLLCIEVFRVIRQLRRKLRPNKLL